MTNWQNRTTFMAEDEEYYFSTDDTQFVSIPSLYVPPLNNRTALDHVDGAARSTYMFSTKGVDEVDNSFNPENEDHQRRNQWLPKELVQPAHSCRPIEQDWKTQCDIDIDCAPLSPLPSVDCAVKRENYHIGGEWFGSIDKPVTSRLFDGSSTFKEAVPLQRPSQKDFFQTGGRFDSVVHGGNGSDFNAFKDPSEGHSNGGNGLQNESIRTGPYSQVLGQSENQKYEKQKESLSDLENVFCKLNLQHKQLTSMQNIQTESRPFSALGQNESESITEILFQQNEDGDTLLHLSVIHQRLDITFKIMTCLESPFVLNIQNNLKQTVLHLAVLLDLSDLVRTFVLWGAKLDIQDRNGNTPLHIACERGNTNIIISLTKAISENETRDVSYNVPHYNIPQDMELRNFSGLTCLHIAALNGQSALVNYFVQVCGASINAYDWKAGETILHQVVQKDNKEMVNYLLSFDDIEINARRYDGCTPLNLAKGRGYYDIVDMLENKGGLDLSNEVMTSVDSTESSTMDSEEGIYDDFKIGGHYI